LALELFPELLDLRIFRREGSRGAQQGQAGQASGKGQGGARSATGVDHSGSQGFQCGKL
jgi:hypothetical protein